MKRLAAALTSSLLFAPALFAQDSPVPSPADTGSPSAADVAGGIFAAGCGCVGSLIGLAVALLMIIGMWKIFTKAGKPGWGAIIPIYNIILLCEIAGRPAWWVVLTLIPFVNIIVLIILCIDLAKAFGKGAGYGFGLIILPFIFFPMLGFGSAQYRGPQAAATT